MCTGGGELITADEPAVVTKPLLDPIVVENDQGDGGLANSASADESDRFSARSTIFSINSSRPKKVLGGRSGDSPGVLVLNVKLRAHLWFGLLTWFESTQE